jgi:hypothetical protein
MASVTEVNRDNITVGASPYGVTSGSTTIAYIATKAITQLHVDIVNIAAGDEFIAKLIQKIDNTNARVSYQARIISEDKKGWTSPQFIVTGRGWEWTVEKAGGIDRALWMTAMYVS